MRYSGLTAPREDSGVRVSRDQTVADRESCGLMDVWVVDVGLAWMCVCRRVEVESGRVR
jgi:hypothetical protein